MNRIRAIPPFLLFLLLCFTRISPAAEISGEISFNINLAATPEAKDVKLWFPYPTSDSFQRIENLNFSGNYSRFSLSREPKSGAFYLYTEWNGPFNERSLSVSFHVRSKEHREEHLMENSTTFPPEVRKYLESEFWLPADDPEIQSLADNIVSGKDGILRKARAIYDWTVENTRRDPNVPGCGLGNVEATLASRSGKCADISSVFVALARAAGVPAREVFGLRLSKPGQTDITDGHHCWAEFFLPGSGWVPVDPPDVRKIMLTDNLSLKQAHSFFDYYFGSVDQFRISLQKGGRGLTFPEGNAKKVNYFMYPYAEVDGKVLDYCRPQTFAFTVSFQKD